MAFKFKAQEAVREKIAVKIALIGPSGSGKSYSALRLATGMVEEMKNLNALNGTSGKILLANTEGPRGRYYASEFAYDIVDLEPPYNPELFVELINYAISEKYSVLCIDSSSAEWEGKGGCLELQQQAGGKYQDWKTVTPRHDKFINAIEHSPIHIIATMKGKDQYEVDKDDRGKVSVKKLGIGAKQREGTEYSYTTTFMLDIDSHSAKCEKDNTHIFENEGFTVLSEEYGRKIIQWANSSDVDNSYGSKFASNAAAKNDVDNPSSTELGALIEQIDSLCKALTNAGIDKTAVADTIKTYHSVNGKPVANYRTIKDVSIARNILSDLEKLG